VRTCPAPDCGTPIGHDFFLCPRHWRALELGQQVAVSAAFRRYKRARERGGTEELQEAWTALRETQAQALATLTPATTRR